MTKFSVICIFLALTNYLSAQIFQISEPQIISPTHRVYISTTGNNNNSGDSISPLATFSAALNKLDLLTGTTNGNVYTEVVVFEGTYYEMFRQPLNKYQIGTKLMNVSLRGKGNVMLDGTNITVNVGGGMIYLLGSNIYVKNMTVKHSTENGVRFGYNFGGTVINSQDILIDSVEVSETAGHGILLGIGSLNSTGSSVLIPRAKRFKVTNCHVHDAVNYNTAQTQWGSSIKFWNASQIHALNNHVHDNSGEGINFDFCDSAEVRENILHDNYANIYLDKMEAAHVHRNFIYNESKKVSGILTGLEAFTVYVTNYYIKDVYIENNIILNTLGINLWQGIYSAIQNGIYSNVQIRHNTIVGKQYGDGAQLSISHQIILGQPVPNFTINAVSFDRNIISANADSLNNNRLLSAPLNPQPGFSFGYNLYNMNPGFGYNSSTDLINTNIAPNVIPSQVNFDLAPNSNYNPELIMSVPNSAVILTDFFGDLRNQTNTNAGAIELNPSLASLENMEIEFNVFPNPFKDEFMIITREEYIGREFQIFDISGKLVEDASIYSTEQRHKISLKTGMYFLKIGDKTLKLISF
jgi:hypothetical protein